MKHKLLFSEEEIQKKVQELSDQIMQFYGSQEILAIGILKGAFVFYSDLLKYLGSNVVCDFMSISYYGDSKTASKEASIHLDVTQKIENKKILLIDCIIDQGRTIQTAKKHIEQRNPESIHIVGLVTKPAAHKNIQVDFSGFKIEQDAFVIGYGIDYKNQGRNLPYFAQVLDLN